MTFRTGPKFQFLTRRRLLALTGAGATAAVAATPAFAQCQIGPKPHKKGPLVFLNYDQVELDAAYSQPAYEPNLLEVVKRYGTNSEITRSRIGQPERVAYGSTEVEKLDIFRTKRSKAPIFVFIHGGNWSVGSAKGYAFPAEAFVKAGAHYVVPDFGSVKQTHGNLLPIVDQVRRAVAWVYKNADSFGGDSSRLYVCGHSSGGHLAAVVLTTNWPKNFGLPANTIKGGICLSGIYDLTPVKLSSRSKFVNFDDATVEALSPQRHIDQLKAPLLIAYGTYDTPEFQRQGREFAAAVKAAGKAIDLVVAENYSHLEMPETLANPYGVTGYPTLQMMQLG
jgi:arylformamidase